MEVEAPTAASAPKWETREDTGKSAHAPTTQGGGSVREVRNMLYLFGGAYKGNPLQDLYRYVVSTTSTTSGPEGRTTSSTEDKRWEKLDAAGLTAISFTRRSDLLGPFRDQYVTSTHAFARCPGGCAIDRQGIRWHCGWAGSGRAPASGPCPPWT